LNGVAGDQAVVLEETWQHNGRKRGGMRRRGLEMAGGWREGEMEGEMETE
jgi:hypothetical protein